MLLMLLVIDAAWRCRSAMLSEQAEAVYGMEPRIECRCCLTTLRGASK